MTGFRNLVDVILTPDDLCQHLMYDVNCTAQCTSQLEISLLWNRSPTETVNGTFVVWDSERPDKMSVYDEMRTDESANNSLWAEPVTD